MGKARVINYEEEHYNAGLERGFIGCFMNRIPPELHTQTVKALARKEAKKFIEDLLDK